MRYLTGSFYLHLIELFNCTGAARRMHNSREYFEADAARRFGTTRSHDSASKSKSL